MVRLILHIGPGKCGSSSIQQFFETQKHPCIQRTHYKLLSPSLISELNSEEPSKSLLGSFSEQLSGDLKGYESLILSHEFLFQNPHAVKNICCLAENLTEKIYIIGYSRRQSDHLVSAYSQWLFRSPKRVHEVANVLAGLELDPALFTGLERQLIASIENDFYSARQLSEYSILDWNVSYNNISQCIHEGGVVLKCGTLPNNESDVPLIHDFCAKADLTLQRNMNDAVKDVANLSFNQDVIEAINNAVVFGLDAPGPHESNDIIALLSAKVKTTTNNSPEFISALKMYIDNYFWESNKQLCTKYNLSQSYFRPKQFFSKSEIIDMVVHENHRRSTNKSTIINNYRRLSAKMIELCIALAKGR